MAVILTKKTETSTGIELTDIYINISEVYINKTNGKIQVCAVPFASKKARIDKKDPIKLKDWSLFESQISTELDPTKVKAFDIGYMILKSKLAEMELTSKDDI